MSDNQITQSILDLDIRQTINNFKIVLAYSDIESGIHAGKQRVLYGTLSGDYLVVLNGEYVTEADFIGTNIPYWVVFPAKKSFYDLTVAAIIYNALESKFFDEELK